MSPVRDGTCSNALCWCRPYGTPEHSIACQLLQRRRTYSAQATDSSRPRAPAPKVTNLTRTRKAGPVRRSTTG